MTPTALSTDRLHTVQFYTSDAFLVDDLEEFIEPALRQGCSAVVIATKVHRETLLEKLRASGLDMSCISGEGRYQSFDAGEVLSRFMINGEIDQFRFFDAISAVIARASAASRDQNHRVVAFGEMVALLWAEKKTEAAIQLEKLWNALSRTYSFSLHCAHPLQSFHSDSDKDVDSFIRICKEHSLVVSADASADSPEEGDVPLHNSDDRQPGHVLDSEIEWGHREDSFRQFFDAVQDYAIFMMDTDGRITTWNSGAERIKGYRRSEILGRHLSILYTPEDISSGKPERLLALARETGRAEDEGWRVLQDGTRFWARVTITAIRNEKGELIGFGKVTRDLNIPKHAESILHRQEERFQMFVHAVQDYAMFVLDPQGYVTTWNIGAERIKGYTASEIIGRHFSCFYPLDVRDTKPKHALKIAAREGRYEDEGWRLRKDGSKFWADVVITAIRDESGQIIGFGKVTRDLT
ncbi:MAG: PAS domain S-box protein, partial [Terracidiphilus sp.]